MRYRMLRFPDFKPKAVTFSYDDGCNADKRLATLMADYGIKGTFNINSSRYGMNGHLTVQDIKDYILAKGHEIAVHGDLHKANGNIRPIEGIKDVLDCRISLEKEFGIIVRGMAYPDTGVSYFHNGTTYEMVKNYLTELDIAYARALNNCIDDFSLPQDWHKWLPTAHHNSEDVFEKIETFLNIDLETTYIARRTPKLFYLWGHAYEFDNKNNWDRMEEICKKLSNNDEIWYATNIEIYDYITAYHSLVFSADGTLVYNPTLLTVYFDADGTKYSVKPGETINIK